MARPEMNTVAYFPHKIGDGKKMFFMENKYGNDGYATWFKILEKIASTENHYLNLNQEEEVMYLAAKCRVTESKLFDIINDLTRLGVFDKEMWCKRVLWDQTFVNSVQDAYKKRNNNCTTLHGLRLLLIGLGIPNDTLMGGSDVLRDENDARNPQSKEEYSKVEESKVDVSKDTFVGLALPTPTCVASFKDRCSGFVIQFNNLKKSKYQATDKVKKKLKARLINYTSIQIISALKLALKDPKHVENNLMYVTPEFILREDVLERYLNLQGDFTKQNELAVYSAAPKPINHQTYEH